MNTNKISWEIYRMLKEKGAEIGNASVPLIEAVLDKHLQQTEQIRAAMKGDK